MTRERVAVVGGGIAGLTAARALAGRCDVTLLEARDALGGHARTIDVPGAVTRRGEPIAVDVGFIVFNRATYPRFCAMLDELGVASRASDMAFSVRTADGRVEYGSSGVRAMFARRGSARSRRHWRLVAGILRFLARARADLATGRAAHMTLDEYLSGAGADVRACFAVPLAAALWSLPPRRAGGFPAETFLRFLHHHGMLRPLRPLPWRTITGGSRRYVDAVAAALGGAVEIGAPVAAISRDARGVTVVARGRERRFDRAVLAVPADRALTLLDAPRAAEAELLGAFGFSDNEVVLHTDASFLPPEPAARASWNYEADPIDPTRVAVTYWMNRLQGLDVDTPYLVTLNPRREIPAARVIHRARMRHPIFDRGAIAAQRRVTRLQGAARTYFAGAWQGYGFHEDGVRAGLRAAARVLADVATGRAAREVAA